MYGTAIADEPSAEELEAARLGFRQMLRRKRISARFIEAHGEDLLARARFEYSRAVRRGDEIRSPAGWIIHCAWRRTQNQLEAESNEPQLVSTEKAAEVVDVASPTPEQAAIDADRARAIEAAMGELSADQRTLIELSYFEGLSVREAGRTLGWHSSKAQRTHESALRRLRSTLGITDVDELAIEIGLAAWISLSATKQVLPALPGGVEAIADAGQRGAQGLWARGQELARRVLLGGSADAPGAMAAGNAARAAGVCGAAAVACLAGGVVGPGVGVVGAPGGEHPPPAQTRTVETAGAEAAPAATTGGEAPPGEAPGHGKFGAAVDAGSGDAGPEPREARKPTPAAQTADEFGAFGGGGASSPSEPEAASAAVAPRASGDGGGQGSSAGSSAQAGAAGEFGAFK